MKKYSKFLSEKTLTSSETKTKEDLVKGMKKNLSSFKEKYGKDAKSVLYATATKKAKEISERTFSRFETNKFMAKKAKTIQDNPGIHPTPKGTLLKKKEKPIFQKDSDTIHEGKSRKASIVYEAAKKSSKKSDKEESKESKDGEVKLSGKKEKFFDEPTLDSIQQLNPYGV